MNRRQALTLTILGILAVGVKWFSLDRARVERLYSLEFYPVIGRIFRTLVGWILFSVGDILYFFALIWLIYQVIRFVRFLRTRRKERRVVGQTVYAFVRGILILYLVFNIFWGLNYNRQGIAQQLDVPQDRYDTNELRDITRILVDKVNYYKRLSGDRLPSQAEMYRRTKAIYDSAGRQYAFLRYPAPALKTSFYGWLGNYMGFTGYYNPFSSEAQVNTTVPGFLQPFICCHEVAHQLGYAKENEANFAAYVAVSTSRDPLFLYSTYFDLWIYANRSLFRQDSAFARQQYERLDTLVKQDLQTLREFLRKHQNPLEPTITWLYSQYLQANDQPKGIQTYSEVLTFLVGYYRKYGRI